MLMFYIIWWCYLFQLGDLFALLMNILITQDSDNPWYDELASNSQLC